MTTPCGNAPDVAIWYACTVPDMSERINNIENTAQHLFFCKSSQIFFTNIGLVHLCLTKILLLLSMQTYQTHFKRILQILVFFKILFENILETSNFSHYVQCEIGLSSARFFSYTVYYYATLTRKQMLSAVGKCRKMN